MEGLKEFNRHFNSHRLLGIAILLSASMVIGLIYSFLLDIRGAYVDGIKTRTETVVVSTVSEQRNILQTNRVRADFEFNAIAPFVLTEGIGRGNIDIRTSSDGRKWTDWMGIEVEGSAKDGDRSTGLYPETPLFVEAKYFQFKVTLQKSPGSSKYPKVKEVKVNYLDTRNGGGSDKSSNKVVAANNGGGPRIISRAEWGSPDPYGHKFRGTSKYWRPRQAPVRQVFLHHTVSPSFQSDPKSIIRAIWDYHANTRGWGDIGYSYLIDSSGNIYEGRFGGDNVVAGHVYKYNNGSLGVGVLGCFQHNSSTCQQLNNYNVSAPNSAVINGLTDLLSWKTSSMEINPQASHNFCNTDNTECRNLNTIAGHRDAGNTTCNGQLFYDLLPQIRQNVATKNTQNLWSHAAKQVSYLNTINLSKNETTPVTLSFKNTGTSTWSNTTNRVLLRTANPNTRTSIFNSGWLDGRTPTILNESSVAPGSTGTFTFNLSWPTGAIGSYSEGFRLVSESSTSMSGYFSINLNATLVHPDGTLIKASGSNAVFLIEDGKRRHVINPTVFRSHGFSGKRIKAATQSDNLLPYGQPLNFREGTIVKGDSDNSVYVIDYNNSSIQKRAFAGPAILKSLGYTDRDIFYTSNARLPSANGPLFDSSTIHPDGTLVKADNDNAVFLIEDGKRRHVMNPAVFRSHGFSGKRIKVATDGDNVLAIVNGLNLREGTVINGETAAIYVVDYSSGLIRKRGIANLATFFGFGYSGEDILFTSEARLPQKSGSTIRY